MEIDWYIKLAIVFILLLGSAFFSGSEVALFSLDRKSLEQNFNKNGIIYRYLLNLISFPRRLLVTILIGNTLVNVGVSIVAVSLAIDFSKYYDISLDLVLTIQILLLTFFILIFGELLPKIIASKHTIAFARFTAIPLNLCSIIIFPIAESLTEIIKLSSTKLSFNKDKSALSKDELVLLANIGKEKGTIKDDQHSLISSIVTFSSLSVDEVMTPRVDMITVSVNDSYESIIKTITESGHSRVPVYNENIDEIVGIVFAKDLLKFIKNPVEISKFELRSLLKKPLFIPETKLLSELLKEFQLKKIHIAIVVDEYGGTAGLISLEDIIEEVVGDIWDEFDKEENHFIHITENNFVVMGKTKLNQINEQLDVNFLSEDDDYDTIGGYILNKSGSIPKDGYSFVESGFKFTVQEVQKKRIKKVLIEKITTAKN